jgi:hypothetical protein
MIRLGLPALLPECSVSASQRVAVKRLKKEKYPVIKTSHKLE